MGKERATKQKKVVEEYLSSACCHPSADTVYENVKKKLPSISKATVYRILRNLHKKGEIQEIPTERSRWDYNEKPHPHFKCDHCNAIFDIEEPIDIPERRSLDIGEVEYYRIVFCGVCNKCIKKGREKNSN